MRSLRKAFVLLDAFTPEAPEWTLADLSRRVAMPKPTVHHIMATLVDAGWIDRHRETKKYRLGARLWEKGWLAVNQLGLREVARPFVQALVDDWGETVRLAVLDSVDPRWVIYIDRVESTHAVRADSATGVRAPSYCVATGKAILAHDAHAVARVIARPLRGYTRGTFTDATALKSELALTRRRGYSLNQSEYRTDVVGVAAPIHGHEAVAVAALGVSGPAYRLPPAAVQKMAPAVMTAAHEISTRLGFVRPARPAPRASPRRRRSALLL